MGRRRKKQDDEPKIGHNGGPLTDDRRRQLNGYVQEIERWEAQKAEIATDIGQIYTSAKESGFDTKAIRAVVKERKIAADKRKSFESVCDAYRHALGMLADTPLGQAAIQRDLPDTPANLPHADTSDPPFHPPADPPAPAA